MAENHRLAHLRRFGERNSGASETEGHYDVRRGAAAYAPIVGAFGALAVPTVTVLFTSAHPGKKILVTLATGLLVVAIIASLTGSVGLAAIGAERDETANLPPAVMYLAVAIVVEIVSVLAAFEVLAAIHVRSARPLFASITAVGGLAGVYFTSFAVGDSHGTGPRHPRIRRAWVKEQWVQDQKDAYAKANRLAAIGSVPIFAAVLVRIFIGHFKPNNGSVYTLVGVGLALAMAGVFLGVQRTAHALTNEDQKGLRGYEAYSTTVAASLYTAALILFLP
ncbi:hypothetical protein ACFV29_27455 [Streptomyces sp. NPDC059690]|uniref:hypothetical protein n=1 Tax=Streptomyces sp. NPDC059690 TaxID=3346907 RepID=UPI00368B852C